MWFRLDAAENLQSTLPGKVGFSRPNQDPKNATMLRVKWNGTEVAQQTIGSSEFEFNTTLADGSGPGRLEVEFVGSHSSRTARAMLTFAGFEP